MRMRVPIRETGSILVKAPRDTVFEVLRHRLADQPGLRTEPARRLEATKAGTGSTFILRDAPGGTQVILARRQDVPLPNLRGPREELRESVEAELFRVQRIVDAMTPP